MNIQIYGKSKCFETKKAERYFKERGIKFQSIDLTKFGMSEGEYKKIKASVGGFDKLIDKKSKSYDGSFIEFLASDEAKEEKLLENQDLFLTPIVRNGNTATVGYQPKIWDTWK